MTIKCKKLKLNARHIFETNHASLHKQLITLQKFKIHISVDISIKEVKIV